MNMGPEFSAPGGSDNGSDRDVMATRFFHRISFQDVHHLVLQDMIERGEMKLDDPVAKYLPKSVKMPNHGGNESLYSIWPRTRPISRQSEQYGGPE